MCAGLEAAWAFFGGMPAPIVPDNMKTVVVGASAAAPRFDDAFVDCAQVRGLFIDPARVRNPRDKARVENQIAYEGRADQDHAAQTLRTQFGQ